MMKKSLSFVNLLSALHHLVRDYVVMMLSTMWRRDTNTMKVSTSITSTM